MPKRRIVYVLHQGAKGNRFYTMHARPPRVLTQEVRDLETGQPTLLYSTPDRFIFSFCWRGMEKMLGIKLPLGGVMKMTLDAEPSAPRPLAA